MLLLLVFLGVSECFLMSKVDPGVTLVRPGETVTLLCKTDDHYEYCKWIHPNGQFCNFEWKRASGNITMQTCQLRDQVRFSSKYDDHECGISFIARDEDQGVWRCEIEDYVFGGSKGSGKVVTGSMNVSVQAPTSAPPSPSTIMPDLDREISHELSQLSSTTTTTTPTTISSTTTAVKSETKSTTSSTAPTPPTSSSSVPFVPPVPSLEGPEAEPSTQETGGSSAGVVGGVLLALILIVSIVFGVVYYRRRKSRIPVVAYGTAADNSRMVTNSSQGVTIHSSGHSNENTNFHEYFPPNMTYSTTNPQEDA